MSNNNYHPKNKLNTNFELSNVGNICTEEVYPEDNGGDWFEKIKENGNEMQDTGDNSSDIILTTVLPRSDHLSPLNVCSEMTLQEIHENMSKLQESNKKLALDLARLKSKVIMSDTKIEANLDYIYFLETEVTLIDQYSRR